MRSLLVTFFWVMSAMLYIAACSILFFPGSQLASVARIMSAVTVLVGLIVMWMPWTTKAIRTHASRAYVGLRWLTLGMVMAALAIALAYGVLGGGPTTRGSVTAAMFGLISYLYGRSCLGRNLRLGKRSSSES
ncbi:MULTISPECIES: hypothetical protein [Dyella]|uniref:Transmembrane protein n=2 Tax=Dyella TaxID=231454 RepID=A0A4R0YKR6_9GAMM|nr:MULTISPECIES: hypothetical protein [Dyella]TBR36049.1 hypothetical protein EYV96_15690 [Dyella terrae]TCI06099.1 hypothetical protein EZM97_34785 [Dyella soli]